MEASGFDDMTQFSLRILRHICADGVGIRNVCEVTTTLGLPMLIENTPAVAGIRTRLQAAKGHQKRPRYSNDLTFISPENCT